MLIHVVNGSRTFIQQFCQNSQLKSLTKNKNKKRKKRKKREAEMKKKRRRSGRNRGRNKEKQTNKQRQRSGRPPLCMQSLSVCVCVCLSLSLSLHTLKSEWIDGRNYLLERNLNVGKICDNPSTLNRCKQANKQVNGQANILTDREGQTDRQTCR